MLFGNKVSVNRKKPIWRPLWWGSQKNVNVEKRFSNMTGCNEGYCRPWLIVTVGPVLADNRYSNMEWTNYQPLDKKSSDQYGSRGLLQSDNHKPNKSLYSTRKHHCSAFFTGIKPAFSVARMTKVAVYIFLKLTGVKLAFVFYRHLSGVSFAKPIC
jgi:hypothetical protein